MSDTPDHSTASRDEALKAMTLALRAGEVMLQASVTVAEVEDAIRRVTDSFGLRNCEVSVTLNTITLSYVSPDLPLPVTMLRVVDVKYPRLDRLIAAEGLVRRVQKGQLSLEAAYVELERIAIAKDPHPGWATFAAGLVAAAAWILFSGGAWLAAVAGIVAAALVVPGMRLVARSRVPDVFGSFVGALVVVAVPYAFVWAGLEIRVASAVIGGLYPLLPGAALVASVTDGLSGAPISSLAKGLQATMVAVALALGVLVALQGVEALGIEPVNPEHEWPAYATAAFAAISLAALSYARGAPVRAMIPTAMVGVAAWSVIWAAPEWEVGPDVATFVGAVVVGLGGELVARAQRTMPLVYTAIAILVLVPGFTIYLGMFAFAQGATEAGTEATIQALRVSLAIAAGVTLGIAAGRSLPAPKPPVRLWRRNR